MTLDSVAARTPDGRSLFDNLSLAFGRERTGLVGRNGVGKTTLLRLIAGTAEPAEGRVSRAGTVGVLVQRHDPAPDEAVAHTLGVAGPLAVLARVLAGQGTAEDMADADWTLEARIADALAQVGLAGLSLDRPTGSLSGGEQTRLRLAGLLTAAPDLLVLDEPTNHMDAAGRELIVGVLAQWRGGAVVVSHDRALLRRMDRIVELTTLGATVYGGDYDLYADRRALEREAAERDLDRARRDEARIGREAQTAMEKKARRDKAGRAFAAKRSEPKILLGAMAERAENSGAREGVLAARRAAEAEAVVTEARRRVEQVRALAIPMPTTGLPAGKTVLLLDQTTVTIDPPPLGEVARPQSGRAGGGDTTIGPISLKLTGPERIAVTGPNGSGKSTLLKLIAGELPPTSGRIERPVPAALLDQEAAILRPGETLVEAWRRLNPGATPNDAHTALARFLFRNTAALKRVGDLSGGERLRAALACVMTGARPPQLLILDEPTNHLDLESIEAVETALAGYDGALVVVSHDADFLDAIGVERQIRLG